MHEHMQQDLTHPARRRWTWWRLLGDCVALGAVFMLATVSAGTLGRLFEAYLRPMGIHPPGVQYDGYLFSFAAIVTTIVCLPFAWWLARRREPDPTRFLGLTRVPPRAIAIACAVMLGVMMGADALARVVGVEPPEFMVDIYASGDSRILLFLAVGVAAPVLEEVLFRGYLFGALRALNVPLWIIALVTSVAFAVLHTQYDPFFMLAIFATGVALVWARIHFDSVVPSIAMHVMNNVLALIAVYLMASTPA